MILILLLVLMCLAALWSVMTSLLLRSAIGLALTSVILSLIMFQFQASYAAAFELSVCAGLIPVIFISVISLAHRLPYPEYVKRREDRVYRFWYLPIILLLVGIAVYYIRQPLGLHLPWKEVIADVRQVLWDHKRLDLFGQVLALLAGAYGILILFKRSRSDGR
jgi:NADH-quinone oxidoreductase subunit J